jgi:hypothetical protein
MVRAKFYVVNSLPIDKSNGGVVILRPVVSGSPENQEFYKWTPAGEIRLETINPNALEEFQQGAEYYVDFTKAG